jgi:hypothetical protein
MSRIIALGVAVTMAGICCGQQRETSKTLVGEGARHGIEEVLRSAQVSGSLEYWGHCDPQKPLPDFPSVRPIPKQWVSPVQALRAMFADYPKMRVTQDAKGKIRMIEEGVPRDLLEVRISHVSFKDENGLDGVWVPKQARRIISSAPEVHAFMRSRKIGWATDVEYLNDISGGPWPKLPHVSGDLYNVTVAEALDYVSESFPGLWAYENCRSETWNRVVWFEFYWIPAPVASR